MNEFVKEISISTVGADLTLLTIINLIADEAYRISNNCGNQELFNLYLKCYEMYRGVYL